MTINVGSIDRTIRIILGIVLLSLVFLLEGGIRYIGLIGIIPLLTAASRSCPLYSLIGASTCREEAGAGK
ncbi:MAG: DUF2892 domain-containing protein [Bacteroidetes bacterium]|nr:DUF2892 domain-containing protein [Bacteroidota bacterium]